MNYAVRRYPIVNGWGRFQVELEDGRQFDVVVANDDSEIPALVDLYIDTMNKTANQVVAGPPQGPPAPVML